MASPSFWSFDWGGSEEWQRYFADLYPTPPASQVLKWKKKWFKRNVDPSFDLSSPDPTSASSPGTSTTSNRPASSFSSSPSSNSSSLSQPAKYLLAAATAAELAGGLCYLLWLLPLLPASMSFRLYPSSMGLLCAGLLCSLGKSVEVSFSVDCLQQALQTDAGQGLMFCFVAAAQPRHFLLIIPLLLTAAIDLAANTNQLAQVRPLNLLVTNPYVAKGILYVERNRLRVMQVRADCEVMNGALALFRLFSGMFGLLGVFLFFNFLKMRYATSAFTMATFRKIDSKPPHSFSF
eukprot:GHVT01015770.1.p1 GENE.GHVT01015770.1~~GHVT01015770.1.p1  ORF type:complete len:292 (-),score=61.83 GHVT01015770.1:305-1180(-)